MTSAMRLKAILCFSLILVGVVSSTPEEFEGSGGQEFPGEFPDDEDLSNEESGSGVVDEIITSEPDVGQDSTSLAPVAPKRLSPDESIAEVSVPGPANNGDDKFPEDVEDPDTQHPETHGVPLDAAGFFKGTHFLAAVVIGGCVGLLFAVAVIFLLLYRMRKKDEGSYALDEQKKPANANAYQYTQGQEYYA